MYAAPLETDYRSSTPTVSRGTSNSSDLFAELLRRQADVAEPAPQPEEEAARPAARPRRERAPAEEADTARPAEPDDAKPVAADAGAAQSTEDSVPAEDGDATVTEAADAAPETAATETAKPAADAAAASAQPAVPAPAIVLAALAPALAPVDTAPAAPAPAAPAAPAAAGTPAPAPAQADAPVVDPAAPLPVPPAPLAGAPEAAKPEATQAATLPHPAAGAPTPSAETNPQRPVADMPSHPAPAPAAATAAAAAATEAQAATAKNPGAATTDPMVDTAGDDVRVQVGRGAEATPAQTQGAAQGIAQGLGKLGTGAEVALAAQAVGDPQRPVTADATKPSAAKPQAAAGATGVTGANTPAQPTAATPNAAANGDQAPAATVPQGKPDAASGTFDAALGTATAADHDGTGLPGTAADAGLRVAGTTTGAAHAASRAAPVPGSLAEQVSVQIQRAVRDGTSRITVQLRPAELGPVEVRLDFGQDGRVSATILADRADTLDMLQRDARTLERSLQDAGLKADSGSLSFDLRDGGRNGAGSQQMASGGRETAPIPARPERPAIADAAAPQPTMASTADGGVDIRV